MLAPDAPPGHRAETERLLDRLRQRIEGLGAADDADRRLSRARPRSSSRSCWISSAGGGSSGWGRLPIARSRARRPPSWTAALPEEVKSRGATRSWPCSRRSPSPGTRRKWGDSMEVLIDGAIAGRAGRLCRPHLCRAPEMDGAVYVTGRGLGPGQMSPVRSWPPAVMI